LRSVTAIDYKTLVHRLRRGEGGLRLSQKTVVLVNAAEPLPNLAFLI